MHVTMITFLCPFLERKIAVKTWEKLKATYSIALLNISNENTAYLFEISRYIKYSKQGPNTCYVALRGYV